MEMFQKCFLLLASVVLLQTVFAQRRLTEATLHYSVEAVTGDSSIQDLLEGVRYTCFIKGVNSRMELVTSMGKESTLILGKTGQVVLLKEYGAQHYITKLSSEQWTQMNQSYEDAQLKLVADTLRISGYLCSKAVFQFSDGTSRTAWYTTQLVPIYREFQLFAKKLPGLLVQYESTFGKTPVIFKLKEVNYNPVQVANFDVPEKGYRIIEWGNEKKSNRD